MIIFSRYSMKRDQFRAPATIREKRSWGKGDYLSNSTIHRRGHFHVLPGSLMIISRRFLTSPLFLGLLAFMLQPATLTAFGGASFFAGLRRGLAFQQHADQFTANIRQIPNLIAVLLAVQNQLSFTIDPISVASSESPKPGRIHLRRTCRRPAERDFRVDFVHVLAPRTAATSGGHRDFFLGDCQP